MALPLYNGCQIPQMGDGHKGLWFDRFFNGYNEQWDIPKTGKQNWIDTVKGKAGDPAVLKAATDRLTTLCKFLNGESKVFSGLWHFAGGLGNPHPVENGFLWHPTLGTPYISGAALKGLVRAWMEGEWEQARDNEKLYRWFGSEDKDPTAWKRNIKAGDFVFFDALPTEPVELKADVMTPHMGYWYEKGGESPAADGSNVPADWHNPVPVPFLVAKEPKFLFAVAPRNGKTNPELGNVMTALTSALEWLGAGAKTAVGYGRFQAVEASDAKTINTPTTRIALPRFNIGNKVSVKRIEDPKGKDRIWFVAEDGFGGVVTRGSVPQVAIGETSKFWIAAVLDNGYNFSAEPILQGTQRPQPQQRGQRKR